MISKIMEKMIAFSKGNLHDITHYMSVWTYTKTIGELERLDAHTQFVLEVAAIIHDIACPLCREKYGRADGHLQELESPPLVRAFLADTGLSETDIDRIEFLVSHHHTIEGIKGLDYQILIEADYIVNAMENHYSRENIINFRNQVMRTEAGKRIIGTVFGV